MKLFLVADSAFPLQSTCMNCFELGNMPQKRSFNYNLIHTIRVVEQAFGRLKGRWKIMKGQCNVNDPVFVRQVAKVCCALLNVCERHQCHFEVGWLLDEVHISTPHQPIYKQAWLLGLEPMLRCNCQVHSSPSTSTTVTMII